MKPKRHRPERGLTTREVNRHLPVDELELDTRRNEIDIVPVRFPDRVANQLRILQQGIRQILAIR